MDVIASRVQQVEKDRDLNPLGVVEEADMLSRPFWQRSIPCPMILADTFGDGHGVTSQSC